MTPVLRKHVERWLATYESNHTREAYRFAMAKLFHYWPSHLARTTEAMLTANTADVQAAAASWSRLKQPASRTYNLTVSAWTQWFAYLRDAKLRDTAVTLRTRPVPNVPTRAVPTADEVAKVWAVLFAPEVEVLDGLERLRVQHDRALFALLLAGGLRRSEVARLNVGDIEDRGEVIVVQVRQSKRYRSRSVGLPGHGDEGERLRAILADVRANRDDDEPLILSSNGRTRISKRAVIERAKHLFRIAVGREYTPHCLRSFFAIQAQEAGHRLPVIQQQMGHASITTTAAYDQLRHHVVAVGGLGLQAKGA